MTKAYHYQPDLFPSAFRDHLPKHIYCSDDFGNGYTTPRAIALTHPHIAPNPKALIWCSVFDVDRPGAGADWDDDRMAPPPNWIAENPKNGHAHLGYILSAPVPRTPAARLRPIRTLARIEHGLTGLLGADRAYSHHLTKTPMHPRWRTTWPRSEPYDLDELRGWLPDNLPLPSAREAVGVGRNVSLFTATRLWAYRARLSYTSREQWNAACLRYCEGHNTFSAALPASEVRSIARSVAAWVWARFSPEEFAARQAQRGKRSGAVGSSHRMNRAALILGGSELWIQ